MWTKKRNKFGRHISTAFKDAVMNNVKAYCGPVFNNILEKFKFKCLNLREHELTLCGLGKDAIDPIRQELEKSTASMPPFDIICGILDTKQNDCMEWKDALKRFQELKGAYSKKLTESKVEEDLKRALIDYVREKVSDPKFIHKVMEKSAPAVSDSVGTKKANIIQLPNLITNSQVHQQRRLPGNSAARFTKHSVCTCQEDSTVQRLIEKARESVFGMETEEEE